jgi:hypothetical protein
MRSGFTRGLGPPMPELLDFSYARFSSAEVKSLGRVGVIRYVASGRPEVSATRAEVDGFRAAGLAFVAVWQFGKTRPLLGRAAGVADGNDALTYTAGLGRGRLDPIHFSVDFPPTTAQLPTVLAYFEGVASVLGWPNVGAYANAPTINYLHERTPIPLFWLHNWGSAGQVPAVATLHQYQINLTLSGRAVDFDRSLKPFYGQWGARVPSMADLRTACLDAGLPAETVPDFFTNGHDGVTLLQRPKLGYLHDTVATVLQSVYSFPGQPDWRPDVPSPRCNVYLARARSSGCRTGCPYRGRAHLVFVSAGKAHHAGWANLSRIQAARAGRIGPAVVDASAAGLADDYSAASFESVGVEADWNVGEDWPADLLDLLARLMHTAVDVFGWTGVGHWIHHRQATSRKTDMAYRGDIWARARNINLTEETDMPLNDADKTWLRDLTGAGGGKTITGTVEGVYNTLHEELSGVKADLAARLDAIESRLPAPEPTP